MNFVEKSPAWKQRKHNELRYISFVGTSLIISENGIMRTQRKGYYVY